MRSFAMIALLALLVLGAATSVTVSAEPDPVVAPASKSISELLQTIVSDPKLEGALISVQVDNLDTGNTIFRYHPDLLVNPASVTKVFTTAAALCLLHPSYRFKTEVYTLKPIERGMVKGPLYLKGHGDPFLVNEQLTYLVTNLHTAIGIKRIDGPVVLDDSYFDSQAEGPGWDQDDSSRPYQAHMGALSLNFNSVAVLIFPGRSAGRPARVELFPDSDHFHLVNRTKTVRRGLRCDLDVNRMGNQTKVLVTGRVPIYHSGSRHHCRVMFPTWYTGYSFIETLKREGISIRQGVRRGLVPSWAKKIYTHRSPALGELVRKVNKHSQNFMAEQLFKTLGAEFIGVPGSWWKGQQVLNAFLEEEVGIPAGTYILHNGSGLNDVNRVTASQVVKLLSYMWNRFDVQPDFLASLAVAGADGTVESRFSHPSVARTMRVKTGSLENVRALAGFIHTRGNHTLAFSVLLSDYSCRSSEASQLIDRMASVLSSADRDFSVQVMQNNTIGAEASYFRIRGTNTGIN